jgi:hypothetical protein
MSEHLMIQSLFNLQETIAADIFTVVFILGKCYLKSKVRF